MTSTIETAPFLRATEPSRERTWPLVRYGLEMAFAMTAGMLLLGGVRNLLGLDLAFTDHPGASYSLMVTDMTLAMGAWMRFRGHGWVPTTEMCAAMYLPLVLLPLVRTGTVSTTAFMVLAHVLMVVSMTVVLWRHHRPSVHFSHATGSS